MGGHLTETCPGEGRRSFLAGSGGAVLTALTGCLGGGDDGDNGADSDIEFEHPEAVRIDESFSVEVHGLPDDTVEITVSLADFEGTQWSTRAAYETTGGTLDLDSAVPADAAFDAGTMNLVQWARSDGGGYYPHWENGDEVTIEVAHEDEPIGSTVVDRTFGGITWSRVDSDEFVGWTAEPPGDEPLPGVVLLHGSEGEPARGMAQMLASRGFVALALQYFDESGRHDGLPTELVEVPLEFVERGGEWLLEYDRVSGSQVGVWGVSKGGELALLAGSRFETVGAVVSLNGSGYVWSGAFGETELNQGSSWTEDGEPVPYVPYATDERIWGFQSQPAELEPGFTASVDEADEETLAAATVPVERIDGPVLLVSGGDDRLWNSVELHDVAADRLEESDHRYDHSVYEDAGHLIWHPYVPATNRKKDAVSVYGGTTAGYAEADADHWPRVVEAFETLRTD